MRVIAFGWIAFRSDWIQKDMQKRRGAVYLCYLLNWPIGHALGIQLTCPDKLAVNRCIPIFQALRCWFSSRT